MNITIDTNVIHILIDKEHSDHKIFKLVINNLKKRKIIWVYGGSTYKSELSKICNESYQKFLKELSTGGAFLDLNKDREINKKEKDCYSIKCKTSHFNDAHLIAIIIVGNSEILITMDKSSIKYVKDKKFYSNGFKIPIILKDEKHLKNLNKYISKSKSKSKSK